jgi:hypothetical protein
MRVKPDRGVADGGILAAMVKDKDADASLKRLGGGRWQTRDERFTIEPQSGTWVVVDAEQTDELGLPLVRGPFGSLGAAKTAIGTAREAAPAASPLTERVAKLRDRPARTSIDDDDRPPKRPTSKSKPAEAPSPLQPTKGKALKSEPPSDPKWIRDLEPAERRRAKRLIDRLAEAGAPDPEGIARRDIAGEVPAVAAFAIARALSTLGDDASATSVAKVLADGRDDDLGVRWRLVDDADRPITIDFGAAKRRSP